MSSFAENLLAARKASGMTQDELANVLHVARNTISTWEHGQRQPDLDTIRQLGEVLKYDFLNGKPLGQESKPVAADTVQSAEEHVNTVDTPSVANPAPKNKKTLLYCLIAAIVVVLGIALFVTLGPKPAAVIDVHPLESPVLMMQNTDMFEGDGRGWMYTFVFENVSDVPFTPELAIVTHYAGDNIDSKLEMNYEQMRPWMDGDQLKKGDTPLQLLFGTNHTDCDHVDCVMTGKDANGHELKFQGTVELSQEMQ